MPQIGRTSRAETDLVEIWFQIAKYDELPSMTSALPIE
jgi:hypothetical protein